jgi:hypothetical protein
MRVTLFLFVAASVLSGQVQWEAGGFLGGGIYNNVSADRSSASASAGFGHGPVAGAFLTQHLYPHVSGEIRYAFQSNNLRLDAGGRDASFRGESHAVHYDFLIHTRPHGARVRPFILAGAGMKRYKGTGAETMTQPLWEYAMLTRAAEWKPLVTFGGGVSWQFKERLRFRIEVRDYLTPFPARLIEPRMGTDIHGWLHAIAPAAGLSITF